MTLKGTFMSLVKLRLPFPILRASWSICRQPVTPGCENPNDWWAKEQPWHQRQAFSLPWGLISSPNRHAALRNIHFNYTWGWWRSQTLLPCLRTDQYFRSKGTKQLVEQLLLKSFTHWIGTPANTQPHCQRVCVCLCVCVKGMKGGSFSCATIDVDAKSRCEVCGWLMSALCAAQCFYPYLTLLHPAIMSYSFGCRETK